MISSPSMPAHLIPDTALTRWQSLLDMVVEVLGAAGGVIRRNADPLVGSGASVGAVPLAELSRPLHWPDGAVFGALVILDDAPKAYTQAHQRLIAETVCILNDALVKVAADAARQQQDVAAEMEHDRLCLAAGIGKTGVWDYAIASNSLYCDPRWYEIMGRDPADVVKSVEDFRPYIHPADVERVIEDRMATLAAMPGAKQDENFVFRIIRPDGETRWISSSARMLAATKRLPARLVGFITDITEQYHAEEHLQLSLASLRHAEALAKVGSWTFDATNGAFRCSEQLQEMIGLKPGDPPFMPTDLPRLFTPAHFEKVQAAIAACLADGKSYQIDTEHLRLDGAPFIANIRGKAIFDAAGKITGMSGTVQDITAREEARRLLETQGRMLKKSSAELAQARDAAVKASYAKSAFLANMSHELRTPLNAIIGFSEMMTLAQFGPISDRYTEYAQDILSSGLHLLELINQILDLSKIEAGRMDLQEAEIAPRGVLEACARLLRERAEKAGVRLEVEIPASHAGLWVDDLKFRQIVLNLLANAIKFTPAGGVVRIGAVFEPRGFLIEVRDTGVGMKPADIPAALEPFRQVGDDAGLKQQGTGLGLPLAKALAELHGGTLNLESRLRQGTTVTVLFPISRVISAQASAHDAA
ncbi:MAG TPA: PAS domain-containing protein [Rhizomicrobium sp.]|nr:PAS domain-containing protein [Rhizomicrobium sp.]